MSAITTIFIKIRDFLYFNHYLQISRYMAKKTLCGYYSPITAAAHGFSPAFSTAPQKAPSFRFKIRRIRSRHLKRASYCDKLITDCLINYLTKGRG